MFESLFGFRLLDPWALWLLLLVPPLLWLRRLGGKPSLLFAPGALLVDVPRPSLDRARKARSLPRSWRMWLAPLPVCLEVLGLVLVVLALARPAQRVQLPFEVEGIDIFLCIDVSSSMAANDLDPQRTRLDVAKDAAGQFIDGRPDDRIGLIGFARYPDLLCPLTLDHRALKGFLGELEQVEHDGPEDMTGIGTAVGRSAQVLRNSRAKSKVVILLTDGEENVATAATPDEIGPPRAARLCEELAVRVYTIAAGIGKRDKDGEWVALDTTQVRRLAERTGGAFFEARDADAVARVYATIDQLETIAFEEPRFELRDRFLLILIAAMALMLTGRVLQATVLGVLP